MRKFFAVLFVLFITLGLVFQEAEAKRFGGGRSFGVSRSVSGFSRPQSAMTSPQRNLSSNPWMNRLTGFALGGLLAYLLMGNGLASGILSWLLVGGAVLLLINFFRNRAQTAAQSRTYAYQSTRENPLMNAPSRFMNKDTQFNDTVRSSIELDTNRFLQTAKKQFIDLQAAYDHKNVQLLRDVTTPEVFAEIQHQLHERGDAENITEVVTLDAMILDIAKEPKLFAAHGEVTTVSVRFSGMIREEIGQAATAINEIWHFQQANQDQWLVAGIQQQ